MAEPHPAVEDAKVLIGHTIADRYRVESVLGAGGMGAVLRCHHLTLKRDVAVKMLHPELTSDPEVAPRFDREAQSASRLEHPNVMQVFDYGSWKAPGREQEVKYMVMQLLDGHELTDMLGQPLAPERAVDLMLQIVRGLEHAHDRGVVHRDLKPENVYVTKDHTGAEQLKLVDFGIAKIVSGEGSEDKLTRMGLVFGTPHYMSPEQATGMEVDARADLYSAGVMFYELLAGHVPFGGEDPVAVIRMQVGAEVPPLPSTVPPELVQIVGRMLDKNRDNRFQTATEVRQTLEAVAPILQQAGSSDTAPRIDVSAATMAIPPSHLAKPAKNPLQNLADKTGLPPAALAGIGAGVVVVGLLVVLVAARADDEGEQTVDAAAETSKENPINSAGSALDRVVRPGAGDEAMAALDRLITANSDTEALAMLDGLLAEFPQDERLYWKRGKLLTRKKGKAGAALVAFRKAIELDADLLDDTAFYADLLEALRKPTVVGEATELALTQMGEHGHPFLLELVNREADALPYSDRHRLMAKLDADEQMAKVIDRKLNLVHDMWQSADTEKPCTNFDAALRKMELKPEPNYLGTVHKVKAPKSKDKEDMLKCGGLAERLMTLRLDLSARYPDADEERWVPADYKRKKKKRRRGGLGGFFGGR